MSWSEFLKFLSQPNGISAVIGILWSVCIEYVSWFEPLEPKYKRALFFVVSLLIPVGAFLLSLATGLASCETFEACWAEGVWPALVAGCLAFVSGTALHWKVKGIKELD